MSDIDLDHPTRGIDWRRTPGPQIRSRLVLLADAVKTAEAERDAAYRAALETIDDLLTRLLEPRGLPNDPQLRSPIVLIRDVARAVLAGDHDQGAQR